MWIYKNVDRYVHGQWHFPVRLHPYPVCIGAQLANSWQWWIRVCRCERYTCLYHVHMSHLAWTSIYLHIPTQSPLHSCTLAITPAFADTHLPFVMSASLDLPSSINGSAYHSTTTTANNNTNKQSPSPPPIPHPSPMHQRSSRCLRRKSKNLIIITSLLIAVIMLQIAIIGLILNSHYVQNIDSRSPLIMRAQVSLNYYNRYSFLMNLG